MRIAYNPKTAAALSQAPANNDITFDLSGLSIYVRGVRFKGTDTTYSVFKKHDENGGGYDGLVPVPDYNNGLFNRFLREDGTWQYITGTSDISVYQSEDDTSDFRPVILGLTHSADITELVNPVTGQVYVTAKIYACPSTGTLYATKLFSNSTIQGTQLISTITDKSPLVVSSTTKVTNLNADLLDGVHYQNILERNYSGTASSSTSTGWFRIASTLLPDNAGVSFILFIQRAYNYINNEAYAFSISISHYGGISITQLSGYANNRLITKIRVDWKSGSTAYIDLYISSSSSNNQYSWSTVGCATSYTSWTVNPTLVGTAYEFTTVDGCKSDRGFTGTLTGNATTANGLCSSGSAIGDANTVSSTDNVIRWYSTIPNATSNLPTAVGWQNGLLALPLHSNGITAQLYFSATKKPYFRSRQTDNWNEIAYVTDNVASATKLQTARTLWGQSFDGTANVDGDLTGVTNLTASGHVSDAGLGYISNRIQGIGWHTVARLSKWNYSADIYISNAYYYHPSQGLHIRIANGVIEVLSSGITTITKVRCIDEDVDIYYSVADFNPFFWRVIGNGCVNADGSISTKTGGYECVVNMGVSINSNLAVSGNVGIGTNSPVTKLHVVGQTAIYGTFFAGQNTNGTATIDAFSGFAFYGCDAVLDGAIKSSSYIAIHGKTGNVGIGTTNMLVKFNVAGDIAATGAVTSTGFKKNGSSDSYVLLGGGGHKLISDFATSEHTHAYLPLSGGHISGEITFGSIKTYNTTTESIVNYYNILHLNVRNNKLVISKMGTNGLTLDISNITSGSKTQYFQNLDGTIALTSDLSAYLPLAGGTMTGDIYAKNIQGKDDSNRIVFRHLDGQNCNNNYDLYLQYGQQNSVIYLNGLTYKIYNKGANYNGTSAYALNADKVDDYDESSFYRSSITKVDGETALSNIPVNRSGSYVLSHSGWTGAAHIFYAGSSNSTFGFVLPGGRKDLVRVISATDSNPSSWSYLGDLAYTSSNVASATKLTSSAGSSTIPIYFSDGKPVQCSTTLGVSITGNADTVDGQHFSYSNSSNSPTYLWATNSNGSSFLAARGSISVNYANSAGTASKVTVTDSTNKYKILGANGTESQSIYRLTATVGNAVRPIYLSGGTPTQCDYSFYGSSTQPIVLVAGYIYRNSNTAESNNWAFSGYKHDAVGGLSASASVSGGVACFTFGAVSGKTAYFIGACANHRTSAECTSSTSGDYSNVRSDGLFWFGTHATGRSIYIRACCTVDKGNDSTQSRPGAWQNWGGAVMSFSIIVIGYVS